MDKEIFRSFKKFLVFCIVGGLAFIIDIGSFNIFLTYFPFIISRPLAIAISMVFNFTVNRNFTFSARDGLIRNQVWKYLVVYTVASLANVSIGWVIVSYFGETTLVSNIAAILGIALQIPISFFGLLYWAFN